MRKKILFFILNLSGGGAERMLCDIVNYMEPKKYDITVQTFYDSGIYKDRLPSYVRYKSVVKERIDIIRRARGRLLWQKMSEDYVYRKYIEDGYDYEVAFLEGVSTKLIAGGISESRKSGSPYRIAWVHADLYTYYYTGKFYGTVQDEAAAYKKFDRIVCVSESTKKGFIKRFGDTGNICVRYNFINIQRIRELSNKKQNEMMDRDNKPEFLIVTIGRLEEQKGYDRLLAVIYELYCEGMPCCLWIFGEGTKRELLEEMIKTNGMDSYVRIFGFVDNPYCYLKRGDIFVCSSRSEGYGLAIAEAMSLGVPVVSTDCAGPEELLEGGKYGLLVKNDQESIKKGIREMYESKEMREKYAKAGKERSCFFEPSARMKQIETVFNRG